MGQTFQVCVFYSDLPSAMVVMVHTHTHTLLKAILECDQRNFTKDLRNEDGTRAPVIVVGGSKFRGINQVTTLSNVLEIPLQMYHILQPCNK